MLHVEQSGLDAWNPLPPKVYLRGRSYYFVHKNKWYSLGRYPRSIERHARVAEQCGVPWVHPDFLETLYIGARKRAKRLGVPFDLTLDDVNVLYKASEGKCSLSGIKFDTGNPRSFKRRPLIPSLDRMDPRAGYVLGNVRLISFAMNAALNAWGEEMFTALAKGYLSKIT